MIKNNILIKICVSAALLGSNYQLLYGENIGVDKSCIRSVGYPYCGPIVELDSLNRYLKTDEYRDTLKKYLIKYEELLKAIENNNTFVYIEKNDSCFRVNAYLPMYVEQLKPNTQGLDFDKRVRKEEEITPEIKKEEDRLNSITTEILKRIIARIITSHNKNFESKYR